MSLSDAKQEANRDNHDRGRSVETTVCTDYYPEFRHTEPDDDHPDWYDAVADEHVLVPPPVQDALVLEGALVEIKSCQPSTGDGSGSTQTGRWWIRKRAHEKLLAEDGWYVLCVTPEDTPGNPHRVALTRAREVDALIDSWWNWDPPCICIAWTAVFDSLDANGGDEA